MGKVSAGTIGERPDDHYSVDYRHSGGLTNARGTHDRQGGGQPTIPSARDRNGTEI